MLDGRLTIRMPAGTEDAAMQPDIMGPMSSSARETRLMSENIGGAELVVYAQEMFCYSTGDFDKGSGNHLFIQLGGRGVRL